ncbi:Wzz/FepE/Etk N-terminal domain-containing protein [Rheinheimera faecalis]|uniref:Wzz/FepE/Etk N-terminal domain-containing protein n=1 Tax=Rheinheimera faecalis TaxID=2901141 RepID=UPI001E4516C5|nr:Wzz/FepE/Etk N-terminal domain-containing protein [Rheinheimera faecalis]
MQTLTDKSNNLNDEIDLRELFSLIWKGRWFVLLFVLLSTLISVVIALGLPNVYKSDVLLSPVSESSGIKMGGQIGGLAALAGVNLGGEGGDKVSLALEIIKSREFIARFIGKYDLKVQIMAAKNWSMSDNRLSYDEDIYDVQNSVWVRDVSAPFKPEPSLLETTLIFSKMFNVSRDKASGMVTLSVEFLSPIIAQQWVTLIVKEINDDMRRRDLEEAESSITYLNKQLEQTNLSDMRTMLFSLIEEQTKTIMLANVRDEYILKTVDAAVVPELKVGPKRTLIVGLGFCLGLLLGMLFVVIRYFNSKKN